jgi:ubiquinone biosynthesis monooxygenase Coq7
MHTPRHYSLLDQLCLQAEQGLRLWAGVSAPENRPSPSEDLPEPELTDSERKHIAALMRVNNTGEVCAQALYFGQALLARRPQLREHLHQAAVEEGDHLRWCEARVHELGEHTSLLNPAFYTLSVLIGMFAACLGDKISLGFIAATESQVEAHLQSHVDQLPLEDKRTHAILTQMQADEREHGVNALSAGGEPLPSAVQALMKRVARVMTGLAYKI